MLYKICLPHGRRHSEAVMVPILITEPIFKQGQKKQVVYNETQFKEIRQRPVLVKQS